jgi:hypothetical protein
VFDELLEAAIALTRELGLAPPAVTPGGDVVLSTASQEPAPTEGEGE